MWFHDTVTYDDPRFSKDVDRRTGYRTRTILCAPVSDRAGRIVGVIQVLNKKTGPFSDHDAIILAALATLREHPAYREWIAGGR